MNKHFITPFLTSQHRCLFDPHHLSKLVSLFHHCFFSKLDPVVKKIVARFAARFDGVFPWQGPNTLRKSLVWTLGPGHARKKNLEGFAIVHA